MAPIMNYYDYSKLKTKLYGIIEGLTICDKRYFDVRKALKYAEKVHNNYRKDGKPEFSHQVTMLLMAINFHKLLLDPYNVYMAIIFHDLLEDYPEHYAEIQTEFGNDILQYSLRLSKTGKTHEQYCNDISKCPVCSVVKLIDRYHNLSTCFGVFKNEKAIEYCNETLTYLDMCSESKNYFNQREVYEILKCNITTLKDCINNFCTVKENNNV